jgi:hypothetical protein
LLWIMMYDPLKYRVYLKNPNPIRPGNELDSLTVSPLYLPLFFGKNVPFLHLKKPVERAIHGSLISDRTASFLKFCQQANRSLDSLNHFMSKLEPRFIRLAKYTASDLPEPVKIAYILERNTLYLEKPVPTINTSTKRKAELLPKIVYNPWNTKFQIKLHFTETYISPNWSSGGESNMAGLSVIYMEANYRNLKNVQFDNSLEIKVGLNTVNSDSLRNLNVTTDQVRAISKLGLKMVNNWYYSLSGEFQTQLLNNYKKNTMTLKTSFFSPAKLFISLGVDFKKNNNKKGYNLSVGLSPLTYKLNYLNDITNFDPSSYGIETGKHFGSEVGSKVSSSVQWKISDRLNMKSSFYYFTNYTYIDSDWENTLDLMLNNYFSTQFYLHLKLDDQVENDPGESLIQVQQLFSFGLTYRFLR